ncbi:MAG: hypothetical protein IPO09_16505 [Anaeromyxobacter sp.]|nr:hypothetical protein [Anaeromyxobacter sp.]MBL0276041.1 hypothetical protein [Anaeromyxobacter sp.]
MPSTSAVTGRGVPLPLELLTGAAGPAAGKTAPRAAAGKASPATTGRATAAKASTAKAGTAKKAPARSSTTSKATTGYATKLPADYAFLRDATLTLEEKLSRFIGLIMTRSEQDLLRQMEKMAPGATASSAGSTSGGGAAKPAAKKTSLWGLVKTLLPPLGLASQLVGDATLKKLVQQLSGPVLGAAATALGGPALGALAAKLGPTLGGLLTRDVKVDLSSAGTLLDLSGVAELVGLGGGAAASGAAAAASASKAGAADGSTSEKAQLMELQRLQDRDRELFSLFSNMLRAMHETRMTAIHNLR